MDMVAHVSGIVLLALGCTVALASLVVGLPGTFLILGAALLYASLTGFAAVTWTTIGWLAALAVSGEALELVSGSLGGASQRPSRRAMIWTLGGGLVGGLIGTPFFFGVGSLLGALLGAFAGAALAVRSEGADAGSALRSGLLAMRGRFLGFVVKLAIAVVMTVIVLTAAV